ncbi:FKBP-type peptidyl-prolyl cis-trans isomerase [Tunicatimonas pelagia]|uniref:FKBP-type peptidyl-prolyl cis-trans isomerase n=1 Tax=Tunicatimonas pelagia TaxID=931531 RepID=UPI002665D1AE|nr:peptidylprolyl isomerase [Tunicatimonas pelagia]WKN41926.1 peptidylprolyl isomerase [Tunicatimonas pelagia]
MTAAKAGDTVQVHYTGTLTDGTEFDSSRKRNEPLQFTLGKGQMIAGFEKAVDGMNVGESKQVNIPSQEAYGEVKKEMIMEVSKGDFPPDITPAVGQQLAVNAQGQQVPVTITEIKDDKVVLDANHPLAGKDLLFDIELVKIT